MEENKAVPNVIVEAPEGVTVEVIYGETKEEERELVVKEAPIEEAPEEEKPAEEEPAKEEPTEKESPAPKKEAVRSVESEPERIYASDEEVLARIAEVEANNEALREEGKALDEQIDGLYKSKRRELYEECRDTISSLMVIADTYNSLDTDFRNAVAEFNRSHGEVDYLLAYLKSKKEAR